MRSKQALFKIISMYEWIMKYFFFSIVTGNIVNE